MKDKTRHSTRIATGAVVCLAPIYLLGFYWPEFDQELLNTFATLRTPDLTETMLWITQFGAFYILAPVTGLLALGIAWFDRRIAGFIVLTAVVSALGVQLIKTLTARPRPGEAWALYDADGYSFPSGHATASLTFGLTFSLAMSYLAPNLARSNAGRIALLLPILAGMIIGMTRPYLGVHYATDVVAGWALAMAIVAVFEIILLRRIQPDQTAMAVESK